jgi:hypothetical protein
VALAGPAPGSPRTGGAALAAEAPPSAPLLFFWQVKTATTGLTSGAVELARSGVWRVRPKAGLAGPAPEAPRMGGAAPAPEAPLLPFFFFLAGQTGGGWVGIRGRGARRACRASTRSRGLAV